MNQFKLKGTTELLAQRIVSIPPPKKQQPICIKIKYKETAKNESNIEIPRPETSCKI